MVDLRNVVEHFIKNEGVTLKDVSTLVGMDYTAITKWFKESCTLSNIDKARFVWLGYSLSDLIRVDKLPYTNKQIILSAVENRLTEGAIRKILNCTKVMYNKLATGSWEVLESDCSSFVNAVNDAVLADEAVWDLVTRDKTLSSAKNILIDIRNGKDLPVIDEDYLDVCHEVNLQTELEKVQSELAEMQRKVFDLTNVINRYKSINGVNGKSAGGILNYGLEEELWPDEIKQIVLDCLVQYRDMNQQRRRRVDIINDILLANEYEPAVLKGVHNDIERQLQEDVFRMKTNFPSYIGPFSIEDASAENHPKMRVNGDSRYNLSCGKTASDWRAGKNVAAIFRNMMA